MAARDGEWTVITRADHQECSLVCAGLSSIRENGEVKKRIRILQYVFTLLGSSQCLHWS